MKLRLGPIPDDPGFHPDAAHWYRVSEPSFGVLMLLAVPLSVALAWGILIAWGAVAALRGAEGSFGGVITLGTALIYIAGFVAVSFIHELCHAIALPSAGLSSSTTLGFWPQTLTPYVSYEGELTRSRCIVTGLAPFVALSIVPLGLGVLLGATPAWAVALSVLNGFGASADLIGVALLLSQAPSSAMVRNKGRESWWRRV